MTWLTWPQPPQLNKLLTVHTERTSATSFTHMVVIASNIKKKSELKGKTNLHSCKIERGISTYHLILALEKEAGQIFFESSAPSFAALCLSPAPLQTEPR